MVLSFPRLSAILVACLLAGAAGGSAAFVLHEAQRSSSNLPALNGPTAASAVLPKGAILIAQNRTWPITHRGWYSIKLPLHRVLPPRDGFGIGYRVIGTAAIAHTRLLPRAGYVALNFNVQSYRPGAKFNLLMADAHR